MSASPLAAQVLDAPASFPLRADGAGRPQTAPGAPLATRAFDSAYTPTALPCSINVACPEGRPWDDVARSVVKISNGCTGVLVNNTRQDQTPYVLTAYHCGSAPAGTVLSWDFAFNYQSATCAAPTTATAPQTLTGAVVRTTEGSYSDFVLLELLEPIPLTYRVVYSGWSIEDIAPASGAVIGHPRQDLKKITFEDDPIRDLAGVFWDATFDHGSIELGSSGSPLFNEKRQLIGLIRSAITFDPDACTGPGGDDNAARILFPKLSYNWEINTSGRPLSDFLDPTGSGAISLPSFEPSPVWINEVNADAHRSSRKEKAEFVELAGLAGSRLDGYALDVYACAAGADRFVASEPLDAFVFPDEVDGVGFFVLGGFGVDADVRDQLFEAASYGRMTDLLPDGSGILVLRDETGAERFHYQYDDGARKRRCPPERMTRSAGDQPGYGTMGFAADAVPSPVAPGTATLIATPGKANDGDGRRSFARADTDDDPATTHHLSAAYPNPFNPQTQFTLSVARAQHIEVAVYNLLGQRVALLYDGRMEAQSTRSLRFEAGALPSGLYLVRIAGEHFVASQTITLYR